MALAPNPQARLLRRNRELQRVLEDLTFTTDPTAQPTMFVIAMSERHDQFNG